MAAAGNDRQTRIRQILMGSEILGVSLLRSLKKALDPTGLLNPGNLLPESDREVEH